MYLYDKNRITYFAETDRRNKRIPFGIKAEDRTRHMYIIGKTGMGKSTLIEQMAVQDIKNGEGFAFFDPHGKSAALLLEYVPPERIKDVVYFAPFDMDNPIAFNVMEDVGPDKRHLVANGLMSAFKKIWGPETWSARMEYILLNTLLALLEYPGSTLLGVNRMLTDKVYRKKVVDNVKDPSVKTYWTDEFAKYSEQYTKDATPAIQNKIGQFTSNPLIRNIIGQPHSSFDLRKVMDERKILIVNLSKGQLGEGNANLLGGMLITKIYLAAMSRADLSEPELKKLPNFYMYVDEFQSFANESFADILSEARKYRLALVMAHQYIEQMDEKVRAAVFGNVGTQIMFRVGATDAEVLEKEYAPVFTAEDMVNLGFAQIYLKLMIDGVASHPFSAVTLPPVQPPEYSKKDEVVASSRTLYAHPRTEVEKSIGDWYGRLEEESKKEPREVPPREERRPAPSERSPSVSQGEGQAFKPREERAFGKEVAPQTPKTAKPFAQAFSNSNLNVGGEISRSVQAHKPQSVPLSTLGERKRVSTPITKGKSERSPNMSALKSALADIVKEQPASPPATLRPTPPPAPSAPLSPPVKSQERVVPPPSPAPQVLPQEKTTAPQTPLPPETSKVREVPEDVLTAILRGED